MSFKDFTSTDKVAELYHLVLRQEEPFDYKKIPVMISPAALQADLEFELHHRPYSLNEQTLCEGLIYPVLREVWKRHPKLQLWSHVPLQVDNELTGIPDYLVCKKSPQGLSKLELPLLALMEAKQENFAQGWGQCLASMVAAQKLNADCQSLPVIYGVVTTGKSWEFGQLIDDEVKIHPFNLSLVQIDQLLGVLDYIFNQCDLELAKIGGEAQGGKK